MSATHEVLSAHYVSEYPYRRSLGPVLGRFFAGLRDRRLLGVRAGDGKVIVPPTEYDPRTGESLSELVEVGPEGTVESWTWIESPRPRHPLQTPFAFALVRLDGADVPMLHAVDAGAPEAMRKGLRVRPRWAEARSGSIRDLACFEIAEGAKTERTPGPPPSEIAPIGTAAFTTFAEGAPPEKVVAFLNELFTVLTEVVFRHGGMVDKFLGDAVLAMFHDQGLPVLKHASFGGGVNVTLGLPIIRTSVDHGTALDLAGSGRADPGSLFAAVELAIAMAKGQTKP